MKPPRVPIRSEWTPPFLWVQGHPIRPACLCQDRLSPRLPASWQGQVGLRLPTRPSLRLLADSSWGRGSTFHWALGAVEVMKSGGYQNHPLWKNLMSKHSQRVEKAQLKMPLVWIKYAQARPTQGISVMRGNKFCILGKIKIRFYATGNQKKM